MRNNELARKCAEEAHKRSIKAGEDAKAAQVEGWAAIERSRWTLAIPAYPY